MGKRGSAVADAYVNLIPSAEGFSDGIEKAINEGTRGGSKSAVSMLSNLGMGFAQGIGQAAFKTVTELGSKAVEVAQQAIGSYAEYEQLIGGVETLFGPAAQYVEDYADAAFKSAGISANKYMETVNSMAAALNQATGSEWQSAKLANQAVIDMSDNANKMGTSMEAIQNAYNGFSKQNYTMLDNLKLGYGGTKQEMERLLEDATKLSGVEYNMESYADIVQAIHVIQEEMGVAGTTAKEATETIDGSLKMVKASWENLIAGLGKEDADISGLMDKLQNSIFGTDSEKGFLDNLLPRVEKVVSGVQEFATQLITRLPGIAAELLPHVSNMLIVMATTSINSLSANLPNMIESLSTIMDNVISTAITLVTVATQNAPYVLEMALSIIISLANALAENIPLLIPTLLGVVTSLVDIILDNLPLILDAASKILNALIEGILSNAPELSLAITQIVYSLSATAISLLPQILTVLLETVYTLVGSLADALAKMITVDFLAKSLNMMISAFTEIDWAGIGMDCLERLAEGALKAVGRLTSAFSSIIDEVTLMFLDGTGATEWLEPFIDNIVSGFNFVINYFKDSAANVVEAVKDFFQPAVDTIVNIWNGFMETFGPLIDAFAYLFETIWEAIKVLTERAMNVVKSVIEAYWNLVVAFWTPILETIKAAVDVAFVFIKEKIVTPLQEIWSKVVEVWNNVVDKISTVTEKLKTIVSEAFESLKQSVSDKLSPVLDTVSEIWDTIKEKITEVVSKAAEWGKDLITNFVNGVKENIPNVAESITNVADNIRERLHFSEPDKGPLSDFSTYAPDMMRTFAQGIADNERLVTDQIDRSFNFGSRIAQNAQDSPAPALAGAGGGNITIPVYIGNDLIQTIVVDALNAANYRSGGR